MLRGQKVKAKINTVCFMSMLLLGVYISVYQSIINSFSKIYSINNAVVGIIIALHFIGSLIAPVIFEEISDRIGKKPVVIISLSILISGLLSGRFHTKRNLFLKGGLLTSLLFIITALLFRNSMVSLVCFIGAGLGFSAVWPVIMPKTAEYYPQYTK